MILEYDFTYYCDIYCSLMLMSIYLTNLLCKKSIYLTWLYLMSSHTPWLSLIPHHHPEV